MQRDIYHVPLLSELYLLNNISLPKPGELISGTIYYSGTYGYYWSSYNGGTSPTLRYLFKSIYPAANNQIRNESISSNVSFSVRCIKN